MRWVGITGGMGSGKSTVSQLIIEAGYHVLSADKNAHKALQKGSSVLPQIIQLFGSDILDADGNVDRKKLGPIVFDDHEKLHQLEDIVHPFIQQETDKEKEALKVSGADMAFYEIPLLFEKHLGDRFDRILVVSAKEENQIERAMTRNGLTKEQVEKRLATQLPLIKKVESAHYVIRNDGSIDELKMKVIDFILKIKKDLRLI